MLFIKRTRHFYMYLETCSTSRTSFCTSRTRTATAWSPGIFFRSPRIRSRVLLGPPWIWRRIFRRSPRIGVLFAGSSIFHVPSVSGRWSWRCSWWFVRDSPVIYSCRLTRARSVWSWAWIGPAAATSIRTISRNVAFLVALRRETLKWVNNYAI